MADFNSIKELLHVKFSGEPEQSYSSLNFILYTFIIIILGVCLWYINQRISKKRALKKARSSYFQTEYSEQWKKR